MRFDNINSYFQVYIYPTESNYAPDIIPLLPPNHLKVLAHVSDSGLGNNIFTLVQVGTVYWDQLAKQA